jgi:hypothetical protein
MEKMMNIKSRWILGMALSLALGAGCGSDDEHEHHEDDPAVLACDETSEEGTSATASTTRDDSAPELELDGEPYAITVSDSEPTFVRIEIAEDTAALLLVDTEDAVSALYHEDEEEELVSAGPVDACADDLVEHFDVDFHEAGTYYLELSPSAAGTLWLLLRDAAGHGHEHDDHDHD